MTTFNKVILMGNLTRDPESRSLPNGGIVTKFGVAVNRRFTSNGEAREETTFVDVESWGKQAELIAQHFTKGKPIMLEGRLKLDTWEGQNGEKRSKLLVVLEGFQFVSGGNSQGGNSGTSESNATEAAAATSGASDVF